MGASCTIYVAAKLAAQPIYAKLAAQRERRSTKGIDQIPPGPGIGLRSKMGEGLQVVQLKPEMVMPLPNSHSLEATKACHIMHMVQGSCEKPRSRDERAYLHLLARHHGCFVSVSGLPPSVTTAISSPSNML